ncbi:hypothetical protein AbraIFM66951_007291 [Aspergillus brasiliensis]|uniref:Thioredoxin reductase n=1 Tax=Aspergillus brasiliensis TaxID=319629 RepID=A0A9W5YTH0_9EURO|nr:hypothetical protein AbraCBS73388_007867 [Aspergillus brasiliensis]GKZ44946.1 hypothetical protein AbraIFM66951_007291 [Aspergillus brasiliensis]
MAANNDVRGHHLDNDLVASISSLLDEAHVPSLLWGNYLLTVYGVPTIVDGVDFVVPDALLDVAFSALTKAGFPLCTEGSECLFEDSQCSRPPSAHLHLDSETAVSLHRKSDVLWAFPDVEMAPQAHDLNTMSASDVRLPTAILGRGSGRFSPCHSSVRVPSAPRYCEALILLMCRDYDAPHEAYWMAMLTYLLGYVDGGDLLNADLLEEAYRPFYVALKHGDSGVYLLLDRLRSHLNMSSDIPPD